MGGGVEHSRNEPSGTQEKSVVQLLEDIGKDKRLNGIDLGDLHSLEQKFSDEKAEISDATKEDLKNLLLESLSKGYSIDNENDYKSLDKVLKLSGKEYTLPSYNTLEAKYGSFSVKLENEELKVYNLQLLKGVLSTDGTFTETSLGSAFFSTDNDWQQNNNEINTYNLRKKFKEQSPQNTPVETSATASDVTATPADDVPFEGASAPASAPAAASKESRNPKDAPKDAPKAASKFDLSKIEPKSDDKLKGQEKLVNVKTLLNIRDANGNPNGTLKNGEKVTLTGNKKEINNVTFVEISKDKYVSLQYLKDSGSVSAPAAAPTSSGSVSAPAAAASSEAVPQAGVETAKVDLSKGVNIKGENGYIGFKNISGISNLPDWKNLPAEIINDKTGKLLSMSVEDGKVNIYFGEKRVNEQQNQYTGESTSKQEYVMKYGEIVNGKFEKTPFAGAFAFDDLANNIDSK